jgi:hypothetical protein
MAASWRDKFECIPTCNSALYWHKHDFELDNNGWVAIRVYRHSNGSLEADAGFDVTEFYPNGPRCELPENLEQQAITLRRKVVDECISVLQERLRTCSAREEGREGELRGWQQAVYALCEEVKP